MAVKDLRVEGYSNYGHLKLSKDLRGIIKNYVDFSHNLITVQANIFKFQLTIKLLKSNQF